MVLEHPRPRYLNPMYSTCLFCNEDLGRNRVIEHFPVGRRLVYDPAKGRLWVVCRKCERWNLSPLEARWEAIEEAERHFRETRLRASTENMGLARLDEGLELVRVGDPLRSEFAAWRYGDQFGRRRTKRILYGTAGVVVVGGLVVGGLAAGVGVAVLSQVGNIFNLLTNFRSRARIPTDDGRIIKLRLPELENTRIIPGEGEQSWGIELRTGNDREAFHGREAFRVAGLVLPKINRSGAREGQVQDAVDEIEEVGHPYAFLEDVTSRKPDSKLRYWKDEGTVARFAKPTRLAIEMALHEEQERRALEGELKALEAQWRKAEEIAAISDELLIPDGTEARLDELRRKAAAEE